MTSHTSQEGTTFSQTEVSMTSGSNVIARTVIFMFLVNLILTFELLIFIDNVDLHINFCNNRPTLIEIMV